VNDFRSGKLQVGFLVNLHPWRLIFVLFGQTSLFRAIYRDLLLLIIDLSPPCFMREQPQRRLADT
jgi:hypothetical protein